MNYSQSHGVNRRFFKLAWSHYAGVGGRWAKAVSGIMLMLAVSVKWHPFLSCF